MRGNVRLVALQSMFIELGRAKIPIGAGQVQKTEAVRAIVVVT